MNAGHDDDEALWSAYLDGTLDSEARLRAEARLRISAADRETLEAMRAIDAQLRTTSFPDPGAAYWRDFGARIDTRLQPATESQADPARIYEKLVGWLVNGGRVRWMRAAGALAGLTLVTYIGMRGFRPSELQVPASTPVEMNVPPKAQAVREEPEATAEPRPSQPEAIVPQVAELEKGAEGDDAPKKAEAPKSSSSSGAETAERVKDKQLGLERVEATQPVPDRDTPPRADSKPLGSRPFAKEPGDAGSLDLHVRGGRANEVTVPVPSPAADSKKLVLDARAAYRERRSTADSLAAFLAAALRDDTSRAREGGARQVAPQVAPPLVKQLNESTSKAPTAPAPPPSPPSAWLPTSRVADVDRLLRLADLAQPYEADATFRPHLETIAIRLAQHARQDPRAASRARALMRTLAASSATASERATWEERLRQLPP